MNATEVARRSDALYHDDVKRRELCDKVAYLEADKRELAKHVASLESTIEVLADANADLEEENNDLLAENRKLRDSLKAYKADNRKLEELNEEHKDRYARLDAELRELNKVPESAESRIRAVFKRDLSEARAKADYYMHENDELWSLVYDMLMYIQGQAMQGEPTTTEMYEAFVSIAGKIGDDAE